MSKIQPFGTPIYTTSERDALSGIPDDDFLIFNKTTSIFQQRISSAWVDIEQGTGTFYTESFDATTSWGAASGGLYTITVLASAHGKGTSVSNVVSYETVGGDSEKVLPNEVLVDNTTGDVSLTVSETPDGRFAGKLIIQGVDQGSVFGYNSIQEDGAGLAARSILNFGTGITAVDNPGSVRTDVSISSPLILSTQPSFSGKISSPDINVTGDATVFTIGSGNAFTEIFDQGNNFNTNGTFTAPVTGRYQFNTIVYTSASLSHTVGEIKLVTSNRSYILHGFNPSLYRDVNSNLSISGSVLADMDSGDTAIITIEYRNGAKDADIGDLTYFTGFLAN